MLGELIGGSENLTISLAKWLGYQCLLVSTGSFSINIS